MLYLNTEDYAFYLIKYIYKIWKTQNQRNDWFGPLQG